MGAAVAHGNEHVVLLQMDHGAVNLFAADKHLLPGIVPVGPIPQQDHMWIVILDHFRRPVLDDPQDRKGGVCHSPYRADRQGSRDSFHAFLQRKACRQHGGDDLAGQRGQDAGLHAAAKAVRQHNDRGSVFLFGYIHMVAAQLFPCVVDAFEADITAKVIHW